MSEHRMPHGRQIEEVAVARMRRDLTRPRWWQTVPGRIAVAGGCVALVSAGVSAVVLLAPRAVDETTAVHCMSDARRNLDGSLPGTMVSIATGNGVVPIEDAIEVCSQVWESGAMNAADPLDPTPAPGTVPDSFTECIAPEGYAVVVPGRIECSALRLHPHQP